MVNNLYTIILNWDDGTFVWQGTAGSINDAIKIWSDGLDLNSIGSSLSKREKFLFDVHNESPVLLQGMKNVWCISVELEGKLALVNIILTIQ